MEGCLSTEVPRQQLESFSNAHFHNVVNSLPHFNGIHCITNRLLRLRLPAFLVKLLIYTFGNLKILAYLSFCKSKVYEVYKCAMYEMPFCFYLFHYAR